MQAQGLQHTGMSIKASSLPCFLKHSNKATTSKGFIPTIKTKPAATEAEAFEPRVAILFIRERAIRGIVYMSSEELFGWFAAKTIQK